MKDVSTSSQNIALQIKSITTANREHSRSADSVLKSLLEVREVTQRNSADAVSIRAEGSRRTQLAGKKPTAQPGDKRRAGSKPQ
jgi:hypothetical protein